MSVLSRERLPYQTRVQTWTLVIRRELSPLDDNDRDNTGAGSMAVLRRTGCAGLRHVTAR